MEAQVSFPTQVKTQYGTVFTLKGPGEYARESKGKTKDHACLFWGAQTADAVLLNTVLPGQPLVFAAQVAPGAVKMYHTGAVVEIDGQAVQPGGGDPEDAYEGDADEEKDQMSDP